MTRDDVEDRLNKVFNNIYDRLLEAYDLMRDDLFTEEEKIKCLAILEKLMIDTVGK